MKKIITIALLLSSLYSSAQSVTPYIRKAYVDTITNSLTPRSWSADRKGWTVIDTKLNIPDSITMFSSAETDSSNVWINGRTMRFDGSVNTWAFGNIETPVSDNRTILNLVQKDAAGGPLTYASIQARLDATSGAGSGDGQLLFYTHNDASLLERGRFDEDGNFMAGVTGSAARLTSRGVNDLSSSDVLLLENASGVDLMLVQNDGNVGIGTSTPSNLLHVASNTAESFYMSGAIASAGMVGSHYENTNTGGMQGVRLNGSVGNAFIALHNSSITGGGTFPNYLVTVTSGATQGGQLYAMHTPGQTAGAWRWLRRNSASGSISLSDEIMFLNLTTGLKTTGIDVDLSGDLFVDASESRVGIGTAAPGTLLELNGTERYAFTSTGNWGNIGGFSGHKIISSSVITNHAGGVEVQNHLGNRGFFGIASNFSSGAAGAEVQNRTIIENLSGDGLSLVAAASSDIRFHTTNTRNERMRITNGGFVGIGKTPAQQFDCAGAVNSDAEFYIDGTQVVTNRVTGYTDPTGTTDRGTFATSTVTTQDLAEFVKALYEDLKAHGLIGN